MCGFRQAGRQWLQSGCLGCLLPLISLPSLPLLPVWAYCPARSQDLLPSSIPDWVIPLTLILPFTIRRCHSFSSLFTHVVLSSPRIPPSRYVLASLLYTNATHFYLLSSSIFLPSFPPSWPAWAYCPARRSHSFCPRFPFSLSLPLFLPHLSSPSTPAFPLRFPSPPPLLSLKVFAQSGLAQRGSTSCRYHPKWLPAAMSDASCCVSPLLFCHHCALLL